MRHTHTLSLFLVWLFIGSLEANAQGPPPYPGIYLASLPSPISHGDGPYYISGTTTLPDDTEISVSVYNSWSNDQGYGSYQVTYKVTVSGGAFVTPVGVYFYGYGSYQVIASGGSFSDFQSGNVSAP